MGQTKSGKGPLGYNAEGGNGTGGNGRGQLRGPAAAAPKKASGGNGKVGSVMVVGAGIAGIQSSLDLADSGYKVYLVEKGPSIGGVMTQLDKTFTTNDCSMCIVSPKLVEAARHNNIELLSYSEVEEVEGQAGSFRIKVRKKARSVDADKCTGCGACMEACPVQYRIRIPRHYDTPMDDTVRRTDEIVDRYQASRSALIMLLQDLNESFRYLPEADLRRTSERLGLPYAEVYGTASFYKAFSLEPRGRYTLQVCMGTACHVRGAARILEEFERILSVEPGMTTEDRLFTLETVNCLGACALGPIVVVDGEYHGSMNLAGVSKLIDTYAKRGEA